MKTKILFNTMFVLIAVFALTSPCSQNEDGSTSSSSSSSSSTVSAKIEVYDGETESARSLSRTSFISTGNTFSEITRMTASVKEGVTTHIDNQSLSKDAADGRWKATLLNLPTGVTLTFTGDAYDNVTKSFP